MYHFWFEFFFFQIKAFRTEHLKQAKTLETVNKDGFGVISFSSHN